MWCIIKIYINISFINKVKKEANAYFKSSVECDKDYNLCQEEIIRNLLVLLSSNSGTFNKEVVSSSWTVLLCHCRCTTLTAVLFIKSRGQYRKDLSVFNNRMQKSRSRCLKYKYNKVSMLRSITFICFWCNATRRRNSALHSMTVTFIREEKYNKKRNTEKKNI